MVLAGFLGLIGVLSLYRTSVTEQLGIPGWALLAVLVLFLALLALYLLRGLEPRCRLCHMSHRIYGVPSGRTSDSCC